MRHNFHGLNFFQPWVLWVCFCLVVAFHRVFQVLRVLLSVTPPSTRVQQVEGDSEEGTPSSSEKSKFQSNTHHFAHILLVWTSHVTMPLCKWVLGNVLTDWEDNSEQNRLYSRRGSINFCVDNSHLCHTYWMNTNCWFAL